MSKAVKILKIIVLLCLAGPIWAQQSKPLDQSLPLDTLFKDPFIQLTADSLARDTTKRVVNKDSIPEIKLVEHRDSLPHHIKQHKVAAHPLPLHIFSSNSLNIFSFKSGVIKIYCRALTVGGISSRLFVGIFISIMGTAPRLNCCSNR